jgi:8-oxo-dGTP pyrophosphatase MutT (NUDIX family)
MSENNYTIIIDGHQRNVHVSAVYGLFIKDNKILLTKRCNTGYQDGKYMVPSGHVEVGENYSQALIREVEEEVGVRLKDNEYSFVYIMNRLSDTKSPRVDVFFKVTSWEIELYNNELEKCDEIGWYDLDNLPKNTVEYLAYALDCIKNNITYSEYGWK